MLGVPELIEVGRAEVDVPWDLGGSSTRRPEAARSPRSRDGDYIVGQLEQRLAAGPWLLF